jgi:hypothetical protein
MKNTVQFFHDLLGWIDYRQIDVFVIESAASQSRRCRGKNFQQSDGALFRGINCVAFIIAHKIRVAFTVIE